MADSTVQQSGGDFTTLATALSDAGTTAGDIITIQGSWTIDDTANCSVNDDNITVQIASDNASYHNGVYNESDNHYRLACVTNGDECVEVFNTGCVIDGLVIFQDSTGNSDECIRMSNTGGTITVKNCIIRGTSQSDKDGIYAANIACTYNIDNCIIYDFARAGTHGQMSSTAITQTWNINSCSIYRCSLQGSESDGGGIGISRANFEITYIMNVYNTWVLDCNSANSDDFNESGSSGAVTWNIDNCISSDTSISSRDSGAVEALESRTIRTATAGGDEVLVNSLSGTFDLLLIDDAVNNDAQDAHSNTSGAGLSLPTLDITAQTRNRGSGKVDIGADAFTRRIFVVS